MLKSIPPYLLCYGSFLHECNIKIASVLLIVRATLCDRDKLPQTEQRMTIAQCFEINMAALNAADIDYKISVRIDALILVTMQC